mmetsp:Transcript_21255/g.60145  ORF Transcript_21255/g.60145 Transcript_21255/m.60145 type:complete len:322 (-) Transcript_21255:301-1266(-)
MASCSSSSSSSSSFRGPSGNTFASPDPVVSGSDLSETERLSSRPAALAAATAAAASAAGSCRCTASRTARPAAPPRWRSWQRPTKAPGRSSFATRPRRCSATRPALSGQSKAMSSSCPRSRTAPHSMSSPDNTSSSRSFPRRDKQVFRCSAVQSNAATSMRLTNSCWHSGMHSFRSARATRSTAGAQPQAQRVGGSSREASSMLRLNSCRRRTASCNSSRSGPLSSSGRARTAEASKPSGCLMRKAGPRQPAWMQPSSSPTSATGACAPSSTARSSQAQANFAKPRARAGVSKTCSLCNRCTSFPRSSRCSGVLANAKRKV